jgi:2,4-dienoyl-CoA reductase-like NADH-dependent reductase (Old Yellow Enzyme family)
MLSLGVALYAAEDSKERHRQAGGPQMSETTHPHLFSPLSIRGVTLKNRIVLAPLCQFSSTNGYAGDWHLVHLGKFALGGFGTVMTEAAAIEPRGRISLGDIGIWSDDFIPGLKRISSFIRSQNAVPAMQIAHAGRKGGRRRPWHGDGPLTSEDAVRGEGPYGLVGPTAEAIGEKYVVPKELTQTEITEIVSRYGEAAARAEAAGYDLLEIHGGHGYLISSFLSPGINKRADEYGGDRARRMRFGLEVAAAVREKWPHKPLFFRMSTIDGASDGWNVDDSVVFARELKRRGVDIVDCSSGGMRTSGTNENTHRGPGYQVHLSNEVRSRTGVATMAVGLILTGGQANDIVREGKADLVAIGRQAMYDPYWAHHAKQELESDPDFRGWDDQSGWWLQRRARGLAQVGHLPDGSNQDTAMS